MENARSFASRFSGLLLFLLSLAVVGLLVYLTINSARDQEAADNQVATQSENQANDEPAAANGSQTAASDSTPDRSTSTDDGANGAVAAETDDGLPNTGPESTLFGAIGLAVLAYAANSFVQSKRRLQALTNR
jgi:hypothetical protein